LLSINEKLRRLQRVNSKEQDCLITKGMSLKSLLDLILDCTNLDAESGEISLSMLKLNAHDSERKKLEELFIVTGGKFVQLNNGEDPELADFKTAIPQTELSTKLVTNVQKDMSDKVFDVKIFELELKSFPGAKKIRFEIFWIEEPDVVFRCDMFSEKNSDGSHMVIEKINIIE